MDNVNKTLYIPLYGKALVSKKGIILQDKKAEELWEQAQFPLKSKSKSKWLAYYMGMRSAVFDQWVKDTLKKHPKAIVLHLGCGLDSRVLRVDCNTIWYDIDFPEVITERKLHYTETDLYHMIASDIRDTTFLDSIPKADNAIVLLEGVSMYLKNDELQKTLAKLTEHFGALSLLVDCYTPFAAKMSKIKNPINDVGVKDVFGIANPQVLENGTGLTFIQEHQLTPKHLIDQLKGFEKYVFKNVYAGKTSKKLYKLYEYGN
ncbi:MAG: class I SAM-dependent methyltransferase [Clostridia bacterium]|nr:class I SAM-dependent methyltransferase [Clostridia bacterium]